MMRLKAGIRAAGAAMFVVAGPVSLLVFPAPPAAVLTFWIIGLVGGLMWAPREQWLAFVSLGVIMIGTDSASEHFENTTAGLFFPVWQPVLLTFSGVIFAYFVSRYLWRRFIDDLE